jgi:dTDP-4-amino-4,6-dideoxygalactose transaminase
VKKIIKLSKSSISTEEIISVSNVLKSEYLGMGKKVQEFEKKLKIFFGREVVCVSSGTAALHLSLQALEIKKGDEVLVPSITYIASFQAISATGAKAIACDVESETMLIDINDVKKKISKKTKAIMPVHFAGNPANLKDIYKLAKKNNLFVIEDAAHAFGSYYKKKLIGSLGDIVCFSFDGIKTITSGEGGCIVTSNKKLIDNIKNSRLLGIVGDTEKRYAKKRSWDFDVKYQGWRYHMSDIMAAIGVEQLKKFTLFSKKRKLLAEFYDKNLKDNKYIKHFNINYKNVVPHIYVVKIDNLTSRIRNLLRKLLLKDGIETGIHYKPNHLLTYYKSNQLLINTSKVFDKILSLPLHVDLNKEDIIYILSCLKRNLKKISKNR